ncbi:MAG TPA: YqhA family protein [Allocoleopsis sp.]
MIHRALAVGRQFILVAVICSFLSSLAVMIYGFLQMGNSIFQAIANGGVSSDGAKQLVVSLIEVIDLFLLGTVFYITALGLYELFIDDRIKVPEWLEIHTIDDLKGKLISVIVVVLGVLFLGKAVTWNANSDLLTFGGSIALVIASLTYFLSWAKQKN